MLIDIRKWFDVISQTFNICGKNVRILLEDVKDILGLEIEGLDVAKHIGQKYKKMDLLHNDVFIKLYDLKRNQLKP